MIQEVLKVFSIGLDYGLVNYLLVAGLAISLRFGGFPDLTIEGTVIVGAAISAIAIKAGINPIISIIFGGVAGACCGALTAILHLSTKMSRLLSSIIVMTSLYTITLRLMNSSNLPLYGLETWYSNSKLWFHSCLMSIYIVLPLSIGLIALFHTELGILLRATGENWNLVRKIGKPCGLYLIITLMISNMLVGVSGAMIANYNSFADVGFGAGSLVTSLAALLIGESLVIPSSVERQFLATIIGSVVYYTIYSTALRLGLNPWDLKLLSAIFVLMAFVLSKLKISKNRPLRIGSDPL